MTLELSHLFKRYGQLVTIDDLTATFEPGLVYGLIGPNGAGKSTIVNLIAGSYALSGGEIRLDGRRLDGMAKHAIANAGIARTYQNIRLFDQMSVIGNLEVCFYPQAWAAPGARCSGRRQHGQGPRRAGRTAWRCWRNSASPIWPMPTPKACPTAASACWRSPARW
ncbi:ATP-binding cassette domain-containing protein [Methylobrevis pamukkalensis]|uniref:Galactose/methyl galactoside import ATP-binding protein MglA n=1 Tax=Methylobrevis pamukkalensis TaxID=1439726 RepID=A0A1E3H4K0_9HYPH|nr:ATP-binding cassette domain-containing protein [Methylobrevis pamukkalensis]ODN71240.1 Galactose/methyl galactoside import ATP-binding protein MglA [Methylobrevis pamukkalensis]